jgi:hypothetical protein
VSAEADKLAMFRAMGPGCDELRKHGGETIYVRLMMGHFTKDVDMGNGEVKRLRRFVFVLADGSMLDCSGVAMPRIAAGAIATFGPGPWEPPLQFRVVLVPTGEPEPMVTLEPLGRAVPAQSKGKAK